MKGISSLFVCIIVFSFLTSCGKDERKGTGAQSIDTAVLSISHSPKYDFGMHLVDSVAEKEFTLTNIGNASASELTGSFYLSLSFGYKGGSFPGEGGTCTDTLTAQSMCTLVVTFTPKMQGTTQSTLSVTYHNGVSSTMANGPTLTGQGI